MLSIHFDIDREWWPSGAVFERLFDCALAHGRLSPALHELRHVAEANGGLALADIDAADAHALKVGLCSEAQCELQRIGREGEDDGDATYCASLRKLLALFDAP